MRESGTVNQPAIRVKAPSKTGLGGQAPLCRELPWPQQPAFTLLEVVFSLALTVLLLGTMLTALDIYRRLTTAGRQDVEHSQLARAILRRMELDIRSCLFRNPMLESSAAQSESETDLEGAMTLVEEIDPAAAFSAESIGIFGDLNTLIVHTSKPSRDLGELLSTDGEIRYAPTSDLKSVSYFLAISGSDSLQGAVGDALETEVSTLASVSAVKGLARLEGDRLAIDFADMTADTQSLAVNTTLLAPEVNFLQFRYFDGIEWLEAWDSVAYERLPNAVEMTIGFRSTGTSVSNQTAGNAPSSAADQATTLYRFVVALPLAEPAAAEAEMF